MQEVLPGEASKPAQGQGEDALPGLRLSPGRLRLAPTLLVAALSGAALSLSLPPVAWWPIAYLAPIPLLWLVRGTRPGRAALAAFAFGIAYFGAVLYWILLFGELGFGVLVLGSAGFLAAFGVLAPGVWRPERPILSTLGLAALWTVVEALRGAVPFGGFAWGQLGVSQVDGPALPLASVAGGWGLSFLVMVVSGLLLLALERPGLRRISYAACAVGLAFVPAAIPLGAPDGPVLDVATVQVDVSSVEHLVGTEEVLAVARLHVDAHRTLQQDPPDLVVWG
jgi:apolipoprotein N-acyltransferase